MQNRLWDTFAEPRPWTRDLHLALKRFGGYIRQERADGPALHPRRQFIPGE